MGAGPGGSATAYHLARRGVDVLMVDKATFPREKVCGDGLTPRAVKAMWEMGIETNDPAFARNGYLRTYGTDGFTIRTRDSRVVPPTGAMSRMKSKLSL